MTDRVLVVDDHAQWRRQLGVLLARDARWQIVGEASDGYEAVEQAALLEPDLVIIDVGLRKLDGIAATRKIFAANPRTKIVILSQHMALDVALAGLEAGACGYIIKSDAGRELLPALQAVVAGKRYISARLVDAAGGETELPTGMVERATPQE